MEKILNQIFPGIQTNLKEEIFLYSKIKKLAPKTELIHTEQYIKWIPVVIEGIIKVFSTYLDRELLLYYISSKESCIMSFGSALKNEKSLITAITEVETQVLLLPARKIKYWLQQIPSMNFYFFELYKHRYVDMLDTINHLIYDKLDKRILNYLYKKYLLTGENSINITHKQIATELGTAREVVSRLMKKLEFENKIKQEKNGIKLLNV
jgi:CRP/FNR family transcriptional regulator